MSYSHYAVSFRTDSKLPSAERRVIYREVREKLLAAGYRADTYFQHKTGDSKAKAAAKRKADALAAKILAEVGVTMSVSEGFFL